MGFGSVEDFVGAYTSITSWRKSPSQTTVSGIWFDLSMSPGNPVPNYYASSPLVAATLNGGEGIFHGGAISPYSKHLSRFMALSAVTTALPMPIYLLDYLLYYPFVDMGTNDEQLFTNSTTLPRYTDGAGVQAMVVMTNPQVTGGQTFTLNYTNQAGTPGRTSGTVTTNSGTAIGSLVGSARATAGCLGPFVPLQSGDTGIRSVESMTFLTGSDVGLVSVVLVQPIASLMLRDNTAPVEVDFLKDRPGLPRVYDGAYLNMICHPVGSLAATPLYGLAEFSRGV